jgi:integrase
MALKFTRLTRADIRKLKSGQRIHEHGITVERLRNGDLRYSINVMVDGQRIHRVVGRESENVTREQAERTIETFRTKAREGRLDLPTGRKVHRTFAEAAEDYLERIEHHPKHGRNIGPKRRHIRQRLVPYFKALRADKLTDFAVSHYIKHRRDEGASTATINRELSTLSHFLNRAVEWKWLRAEQRPKIAKGQETRKRIVVLSAADQKTLMQAAIGDQDPLTWLFTAIALGTGMRHSEILRIRWSDIDPANRRIYVAKAKAGQREQPIPPGLAETLAREHDQLGKPDGYLFPTRRADATNSHRQNMSVQFRRAVIRAKLDPNKVTPHVLRHTAITGLVRAGVDLPTIQRISGHKTLAMVLRYTHLSDEHIDQAVANLDSAFSDAIAPELHMAPKDRDRGAA